MNVLAQSDRTSSAGVDEQNPWPGLAPFTEELQEFFFGRTEEADELTRRVRRTDLTVLFGGSGVGKSSLLQAGLFPHLRDEGYLPVLIRLDHSGAAPPLSEQFKDTVTHAIKEAIKDGCGRVEITTPVAGESLWEHFHRRGSGPQTPKHYPVDLVLVLDQFEEMFSRGQASEEARARTARFQAELADLVENRMPKTLAKRLEATPELARQFAVDDSSYRVLISLREDFLADLESLRPSMPSVAENRMRLTPMNGLQALEAVLEPGGDLVAPEVGRQIVRFVAGGDKSQQPQANGAAGQECADEALAKMEIEPWLLSLVCQKVTGHALG